MAVTLREIGRLDEAHQQMRSLVPRSLEIAGPAALAALAEDYAAILAEVGDHASAVRLLGAADTLRERVGYPRHHLQAAEIAGSIDLTRDGTVRSRRGTRRTSRSRGPRIEEALREASAVEGSK